MDEAQLIVAALEELIAQIRLSSLFLSVPVWVIAFNGFLNK